MSRSPKSVRPEIIFDATKKFQQYHKDVEIVMVNHTELLCLEVITTVDEQVMRMYLNMKLLITKIDLTLINAKFLIKRKVAKDNEDFFDPGQVMRHLATSMVVDMVAERLEITRRDTPGFDIFLKPTDADKTMECMDPETFELITMIDFEMNEKPRKLKPFNITRHRIHNIKFDNLDSVEVIRSSPKNSAKSVRFALLPLYETHSPYSSEDDTTSDDSGGGSTDSDLTTSSSTDDLTLFLPENTLSESDLCALDLDGGGAAGEGEDDDSSCCTSVGSITSKMSTLSTKDRKECESPSSTTAINDGLRSDGASWKRRLFSFIPGSPSLNQC